MPRAERPPRRMVLVMALAVAAVAVPFLFWHQTWFGRRLSDGEIDQYLRDNEHAWRIEHALSQIAGRMAAGDPAAAAWYPQIVALARHPRTEIRTVSAWVMGQDNRSQSFHQALAGLLEDPDVMVRRNAALALARFADGSGRAEMVRMLQPSLVRAPAAGRVSMDLRIGQSVGSGELLARVGRVELRSPFAGQVQQILARKGAIVTSGEGLVWLRPDADQTWEALRGLYLVGQREDLAAVEPYTAGVAGLPDRIRQQAVETVAAIRTRAEPVSTR